MCENCEYARELNYGYKIFYSCVLVAEESETVDTYFNEREQLIKCPKDKIEKAFKEVQLMRDNKLQKKTWIEFKEELKAFK